MSTKTLRWLGVILPVAFWFFLVAIRAWIAPWLTASAEAAIEIALIALFGALFANWVANRLDRHEAEVRSHAEQLEALREATLALTTETELDSLLQRIVDLSRDLGRARYAALGVLDSSGAEIDRMFSSGISKEERSHFAKVPTGAGLLGAILTERRAMRIDSIRNDPRSAGFPSNHPIMTTMLGVPLISKGEVFGNLYLADKLPPDKGAHGRAGKAEHTALPFTDQDQQTLEMFASHAAVAIEIARLHHQSQQLAIMQERERFGMNLHDGVIQSIYALGLILDDAQHHVEDEPLIAVQRINLTIDGLNQVIRDIRSYIQDLRPQRFEGRDLQQGLEELADYFSSTTSLSVRLKVDAPAAAAATAEQTAELLHVAQEALTNTQKHAKAETAEIRLSRIGSRLVLAIEDNGRGFDVFRAANQSSGNGLRNMQERARSLRGEMEIQSMGGGGTRIIVSVPVGRKEPLARTREGITED